MSRVPGGAHSAILPSVGGLQIPEAGPVPYQEIPIRIVLPLVLIPLATLLSTTSIQAVPASPLRVTVEVTAQPANRIVADRAVGAGIDGAEQGDMARLLTPAHIRAMLTAGLGPLTYRLRTELGCEAWHWNPVGTWSDPSKREGYWTSDDRPGAPILISNGYRLPRRGNTIDQANNDGYSRLDDGDTRTFWKSNPYLCHPYTGDPDSAHPQWILIDLTRKRPVDALRVLWGRPYATRYYVEYWDGPDYVGDNDEGRWRRFAGATAVQGGGDQQLRLAPEPIPARFIRIVMTQSSNRAAVHSADPRDSLGYAVREVYLGTILDGKLHDIIQHGHSAGHQTLFYVSSTDSWHRASDQDPNVEQPGFDLFFRSGVTRGLPVMMPVSLLYGTPENAASELHYLRSRHFNVEQVELGEEPDGQFISAEDYGALYVQWARALHQIDPHVQCGGPSLQTANLDYREWPEHSSKQTWIGRFLRYLRQHGRLSDYRFCSFEWYPVDNVCADPAAELEQLPAMLSDTMRRLRQSGLPAWAPLIITEYGYSAFAAEAEVQISGALFNADLVGAFLTAGGSAAYLYGYTPNTLIREIDCPDGKAERSWGQNMLFEMNGNGKINYRMATYYAAQMVTQDWLDPRGGAHGLYRTICRLGDRPDPAVSAYTTARPDGKWAVMLVNRSTRRAYPAEITFSHSHSRDRTHFEGLVDVYQLSRSEYTWRAHGDVGYPRPDNAPIHRRVSADHLVLPPDSLTVVRGEPGK